MSDCAECGHGLVRCGLCGAEYGTVETARNDASVIKRRGEEIDRLTARMGEAEGLLRRCREVFGHGGSKLDIDMTIFLDAPKASP